MNQSRPRLLVLASTYPRWSGDHEPGFVHELAKRLVPEFDVRVLCPHAPDAVAQEILDGVEVIRYRYAPGRLETLVHNGGIVTNLKRRPWKWLLVPFFLLGLFWRTWREIHHWHPDVIHAHWLLPQGLVVALLDLLDCRTPSFLVTSHGADLFALRTVPLMALKRFVARRAAVLTVVSQAMKDELARIGVPLHKVSVQPMGVDLTHRFTPSSDVLRSRDEILFVGRLVEKKGLRYLIAALPEIIAHHPSAFLTVVGFGPEADERRAQAEALEISHKVNFLGALTQAELPALYRRAAVFVAPFVRAESGDQEGLGLVLVEALGCGCPVVVSDLPASRDITAGVAAAAASITPDQLHTLGKVVGDALTDSKHRQQAVCEALPLLRQRFDWSQVAKDYGRRLGRVARTTATTAVVDQSMPASNVLGFATASGRNAKAQKIMAVLAEYVPESALEQLVLLDIGTGSGEISQVLSSAYRVTSIDLIDQRRIDDGYFFVRADSEHLPFPDSSYDVIVSNHVIEHVHDAHRHLAEIARVLRPGGIAYLATPNRWWPWEVHYRLPLLHYLPPRYFNSILRWLKCYKEEVMLLSWRDLCGLAAPELQIKLVSDRICKYPRHYHLHPPRWVEAILTRIPLRLLSAMADFYPTLIVVLQRKRSS